MADARLRTVEAELLGLERADDVEGWEIPGRYLDFLRGGLAEPLVEVVRHNDQDVRSLARLLADVAGPLRRSRRRSTAPTRATWPVSPGRSPGSAASRPPRLPRGGGIARGGSAGPAGGTNG